MVVCDGQPTPEDAAQRTLIVWRGQAAGKRYLPILISDASADHGVWHDIFGSALPRHDITDLAVNSRAALTSLRAHLER